MPTPGMAVRSVKLMLTQATRMDSSQYAEQEISRAIAKYIVAMPEKRAEILDLAVMARDEINDGESIDNEISLMIDSLEELLSQEEKC